MYHEQEALRALAADTASFGTALATAVAVKLRSGHYLGYGHRDYCGMGMDYSEDRYRYGEIWDGYLEPQLSFPGQQDFIAWLAAQSTASLARLDDEDFYQGNQVITRTRLEAFLTQTSLSL
ncbi:hypothetical protein [Taibaiella helva]|uniref:hypothetical protein n=1 Tax=Taibaiella helva TaxID=2301235 RepID=UPI000E577CF9|nr:hypothetical protein [Taibaiella helva]